MKRFNQLAKTLNSNPKFLCKKEHIYDYMIEYNIIYYMNIINSLTLVWICLNPN